MTPYQLEQLINGWLLPHEFKDYAPNGLQLDADVPIQKIATAVTANQASIEAAAEWGADALLVHHGWFWKGEGQVLTGIKGRRVRTMLKANMSLFGYHLPLDAHPTLGNNAELARLMGWRRTEPLEASVKHSIGDIGDCEPTSGSAMAARLERILGQAPVWIDGGRDCIARVAWCTGGAQSYFARSIDAGVDAFVTGEISEPMVHLARESGVHYFAAGHHATERYGVQALGARIASELGLEHQYFEVPSPV